LLVLSRVTGERLFFPELEGEGPNVGRQGKVIEVGSTRMLSKSFWYFENYSSNSFGWTGFVVRLLAWDSLTRSLETGVSADVLAAELLSCMEARCAPNLIVRLLGNTSRAGVSPDGA
jgi:hypothetical protein